LGKVIRSRWSFFFFFQAEDGIRDRTVTGVQTCALPILDDRLGDCSRTARHLFTPSELSDQPRIDTHPVYHPGRHSHDRIFWSSCSFRSRAPGTRHPPRDDLLDSPRPYHPVHLLEKGNLVHARFPWGMLTASGGRGAGDSRSSRSVGG